MTEAIVFRDIVRADIDQLALAVTDAFLGYRVFAPADWQAPSASEQANVLLGWIADPSFSGELACEEGILAGHATFIPAVRHSFRPTSDTTLAHLGHLFVKPEHWGSGVAGKLLARATGTARAGSQGCACSFPPAKHAPVAPTRARDSWKSAIRLSLVDCRRSSISAR